MVIVDTGSVDRTVEVAMRFTPAVYKVELNHDFSAARNYGLGKNTQPWVLWLDADELPNQGLCQFIRDFCAVRPVGVEAVSIVRHNLVGGQEIGDRTWERHVRLFRNHFRFTGRIHERLNLNGVVPLEAPPFCIIQHHKTYSRQAAQNERYMEWEEQRAIVGRQAC